jgi:hypothetical protein
MLIVGTKVVPQETVSVYKSTNMGITLWVRCITDTKVRYRQ